MELEARIGWGIIIYAIVFLVSSVTVVYGWTGGATPYLVELLALVIACVWAGSKLRFHFWQDILPYSIGWAIIVAALDAIYVVPIHGWSWYTNWMAWASYALVALLPLLSVLLRNRTAPPGGVWES